jgi:amino acid permease
MLTIFCSITLSVVIVFFGYIAMWSASQANIPAGISSFGKVMAIILFVIAGLILIFGIAGKGKMCNQMHEKPCCADGASMMPGQEAEGGPAGHKPGMMKPGDEKVKPGIPHPGKPAEPVKQ